MVITKKDMKKADKKADKKAKAHIEKMGKSIGILTDLMKSLQDKPQELRTHTLGHFLSVIFFLAQKEGVEEIHVDEDGISFGFDVAASDCDNDDDAHSICANALPSENGVLVVHTIEDENGVAQIGFVNEQRAHIFQENLPSQSSEVGVLMVDIQQ